MAQLDRFFKKKKNMNGVKLTNTMIFVHQK